MKWFKLHTNNLDDPFVQDLLEEFGAQGYLAYIGILSIYGKEVDHLGETFTVSPQYLKRRMHISASRLQEIYEFCNDYRDREKLRFWISDGLNSEKTSRKLQENFKKTSRKLQENSKFSPENLEKNKIFFNFEIPKMLELQDEYSKRIGTRSGQPPKNIRLEGEEEGDIEKEEENIGGTSPVGSGQLVPSELVAPPLQTSHVGKTSSADPTKSNLGNTTSSLSAREKNNGGESDTPGKAKIKPIEAISGGDHPAPYDDNKNESDGLNGGKNPQKDFGLNSGVGVGVKNKQSGKAGKRGEIASEDSELTGFFLGSQNEYYGSGQVLGEADKAKWANAFKSLRTSRNRDVPEIRMLIEFLWSDKSPEFLRRAISTPVALASNGKKDFYADLLAAKRESSKKPGQVPMDGSGDWKKDLPAHMKSKLGDGKGATA